MTNVNGQVLCQPKDGMVSHFVSDPLGSIVLSLVDGAGSTVYEAQYDSYGSTQSETGTNPSEFDFVGTLGYVRDSAYSVYVRARYLLTNLGRWLTKDMIWPNESAYTYAESAPSSYVDLTGLFCRTIATPCNSAQFEKASKWCKSKFGTSLKWCTFTTVTCYGKTLSFGSRKCSMDKYGDCTPAFHARLQADVKRSCDPPIGPQTCGGDPISCIFVVEQIARFSRCIMERELMNSLCFRGGDWGHNKAIADALAGLAKCVNALKRCHGAAF